MPDLFNHSTLEMSTEPLRSAVGGVAWSDILVNRIAVIAFIVLLIGFMIFVTFFDIKRMIPTEPEKQGTIVTKFNLQRIAAQERARHESETKNQPED